MKIYIIVLGILISFSLHSQNKTNSTNSKKKSKYKFEKKENSGLKIVSKEEYKKSEKKTQTKKTSLIKNEATDPRKKKIK